MRLLFLSQRSNDREFKITLHNLNVKVIHAYGRSHWILLAAPRLGEVYGLEWSGR